MNLLDVMFEITGEDFLSDLRVPRVLLRNMEAIHTIPDDKYSLDEWQYVYSYITNESSDCLNVAEVKSKLEMYARS